MVCQKQKQSNSTSKAYKSLVFIFLMVVFSIAYYVSFAEEVSLAKASGDRINVRARPDPNSEVVTQLSMDEEVLILEEKDGWAKIKAPIHTKCWISNDCITEGVITKNLVNVRSGPGVAYPVLAQIKKGTSVKTIEMFQDWTRIETPVEFGVWVSSKYLVSEKTKEEEKQETVKEEENTPEVQKQEEKPLAENTPPVVSVPEEEITGKQLVSYAGKLEDLGILINRPGTYKIVSEKDKWVCIVKSPTMDVNPYINRIVRVEGIVLSKTSSWGVPIIEVKRLQIIQ